MRDKPNTMKETVDQLWVEVVGYDGEGLASQFRGFVKTRKDTCPVKSEVDVVDSAARKRQADTREIVRTIVAAAGVAVAVLIALFK